ncbi:hypothetical protein PQX77_000923 [Marasmius sp. AFHP31]|nr:hypothetical protein PQX77_000923 [Marasmius sp. AFHP31]
MCYSVESVQNPTQGRANLMDRPVEDLQVPLLPGLHTMQVGWRTRETWQVRANETGERVVDMASAEHLMAEIIHILDLESERATIPSTTATRTRPTITLPEHGRSSHSSAAVNVYVNGDQGSPLSARGMSSRSRLVPRSSQHSPFNDMLPPPVERSQSQGRSQSSSLTSQDSSSPSTSRVTLQSPQDTLHDSTPLPPFGSEPGSPRPKVRKGKEQAPTRSRRYEILLNFGFHLSEEGGALLVLPHGSAMKTLENTKEFKKRVKDHWRSWYEFADARVDFEDGQALYLVTGYERCSTWAMAVWDSISSYPNGKLGSLKLTADQSTGAYSWESFPARCSTQSSGIPIAHTSSDFRETVFTHGFWIERNGDTTSRPPTLSLRHGSKNCDSRSNDSDSHSKNTGDQSGNSRSSGDSSSKPSASPHPSLPDGGRSKTLDRWSDSPGASEHTLRTLELSLNFTDEGESADVTHPCRVINKFALELVARINPAMLKTGCVAFSHDADWISIVRDSVEELPRGVEIIQRICYKLKFIIEGDVIYTASLSDSDKELLERLDSQPPDQDIRVLPVLVQFQKDDNNIIVDSAADAPMSQNSTDSNADVKQEPSSNHTWDVRWFSLSPSPISQAESHTPRPVGSPFGHAEGAEGRSGVPVSFRDIGIPEAEKRLRHAHNLSSGASLSLRGLSEPYVRNRRPPHTYKLLVQLALWESPERRLTLQEIYAAISNRFEYYRGTSEKMKKRWQGSIRSMLSNKDAFLRIRGTDQIGRGDHWEINFAGLEKSRRQRRERRKQTGQQQRETPTIGGFEEVQGHSFEESHHAASSSLAAAPSTSSWSNKALASTAFLTGSVDRVGETRYGRPASPRLSALGSPSPAVSWNESLASQAFDTTLGGPSSSMPRKRRGRPPVSLQSSDFEDPIYVLSPAVNKCFQGFSPSKPEQEEPMSSQNREEDSTQSHATSTSDREAKGRAPLKSV